MQFDHVAWRSERAYIHDITRGGAVEIVSEMPGTLTIIGRGVSQRQAVEQVIAEASRQGLPLRGLPDTSDYAGVRESVDTYCAVTWSTDNAR